MLKTRATRVGLLLALAVPTAFGLVACGGSDFENERRPPVQMSITAVITEQEVDVSPNQFGAGPILLTVSNQTRDAHSITVRGQTMEGGQVVETVPPINPGGTVQIQQDLDPGTYRVIPMSSNDVFDQIQPGTIRVGPERSSSSDELELP